ncbi:unnamed protein product [Psylliodes chrysocephalus]|uniref:Uncharacterized protein n=1 Tax=Psylliodes chrysocephalus TaxID=3402493 RepID=A0A9P0CR97_9CUCU|nr:unnamed protein product [Psylliodes chrysocephala]
MTYVAQRKAEEKEKPLCYSTYCKLFRETGSKIKNQSIDTCKTCARLTNELKCTSTEKEWNEKALEKEKHLELTEKAYNLTKVDKERASHSQNERILVFVLQQNLPTLSLTTGEVYYKRQL